MKLVIFAIFRNMPMLKNSGLPHQRIGACAALLCALIVIASVCALNAANWWIADLLVHFPVQYTALAAAAFVVLVWVRRPMWAVVALLASGYNAMAAAPWVTRSQPAATVATNPIAPRPAATEAANPIAPSPAPTAVANPASADATPYRFVSINVLFHNRDYPAVIRFLQSARPDVAVLEEITPTWRAALTALDEKYPYRYATEGPRRRGLLLLSRWPLEETVSLSLGAEDEPAIRTFLRLGSRRIELIGVHTSWPLGARVSALRNAQLEHLAALTRDRQAPLVVLGDLNISPFSPHFRALLAQGRIRSAAEGFGWQPTWPSVFAPGAIQIDHALVSPDIGVRSFRRGPFVGSDHRPIITELVLEAVGRYSAAAG